MPSYAIPYSISVVTPPINHQSYDRSTSTGITIYQSIKPISIKYGLQNRLQSFLRVRFNFLMPRATMENICHISDEAKRIN